MDMLADESLVAELHRLGVEHLARLAICAPLPPMAPPDLLATLAAHPLSRFRSALILLFLRQPAYSQSVGQAIERLEAPAADTLRLYYQAAVYLRPEIDAELRWVEPAAPALPDLFSQWLQLPAPGTVPADQALSALGQVQARLTGRAYNWAGSYRQHVPLFRRQLLRHAQHALAA
jgi:hypothetical protein